MTLETITAALTQHEGVVDDTLAALAYGVGVRSAAGLAAFAGLAEDLLLAARETPDGDDSAYCPIARDALDVLEAWQDDPDGALQDLFLLAA